MDNGWQSTGRVEIECPPLQNNDDKIAKRLREIEVISYVPEHELCFREGGWEWIKPSRGLLTTKQTCALSTYNRSHQFIISRELTQSSFMLWYAVYVPSISCLPVSLTFSEGLSLSLLPSLKTVTVNVETH